jgi:DNA-binding transcriptional LysR family regulator
VLRAQPRFDPATAERRFVLRCSDSVLTVLGPRVVSAVTRAAPRVSLDFRALDATFVADPLSALREIDILVAPRGLFSAPEVPGVELYRDRWVCATWRANSAVGDRLTTDDLARARWVMPFRQLPMNSPADAALAALGVDRQCAVRVENFAILSRLVVGTDLLVLFHQRLAGDLGAQDLREVELPVELPPITETAWSHPSRQLDPGHRWLLDVLAAEGAELPQPGASPSR